MHAGTFPENRGKNEKKKRRVEDKIKVEIFLKKMIRIVDFSFRFYHVLHEHHF
jgi:hypothetical protein